MIHPLQLQNLTPVSVLGRGAKGVVFLLKSNPLNGPDNGDGYGDGDGYGNGDGYGMVLKAVSRSSIERKGGDDVYRRVWFERDALAELDHPLLPRLRGFVSTDRIVGFVIDRCSGGDLNSLRRRQSEKMFSDDVIRFYAAELVLALEYLHSLGIAYRDLKPENILIQDNGHIMLVDFDLSTKLHSLPSSPVSTIPPSPQKNPKPKKLGSKIHRWFSRTTTPSNDPKPSTPSSSSTSSSSTSSSSSSTSSAKSNSFVGTEEYVAPEIIEGSGHDFAVDWWGLGVVLYEMLYGRTPFRGQNRKETFYRVLVKDPELTGEQTPLRDLIRRLLEKDPNKRISGQEVKRHVFFRGVDWENILRVGRPPFIPEVVGEEGFEGLEIMDVEKIVEEVMWAKEKEKEKKDGDHFEERVNVEVKNDGFEVF